MDNMWNSMTCVSNTSDVANVFLSRIHDQERGLDWIVFRIERISLTCLRHLHIFLEMPHTNNLRFSIEVDG